MILSEGVDAAAAAPVESEPPPQALSAPARASSAADEASTRVVFTGFSLYEVDENVRPRPSQRRAGGGGRRAPGKKASLDPGEDDLRAEGENRRDDHSGVDSGAVERPLGVGDEQAD